MASSTDPTMPHAGFDGIIATSDYTGATFVRANPGIERVLEIVRPVASALHFAHQIGMAHCDVKPANILIDASGSMSGPPIAWAREVACDEIQTQLMILVVLPVISAWS